MNQKLINRFWKKVLDPSIPEYSWTNITDCWEWIASVNKDGYGNFSYNGTCVKAHRLVWEMYRGPIPQNKEVCHSCNNPPCVNLDHLYLDTHKGNMEHMVKSDRVGPAKLNETVILQIFEDIKLGNVKKTIDIVNKYNISRPSITRLIKGDTWSHLISQYYSKKQIELFGKIILAKRSLSNQEEQEILLRLSKGEGPTSISRVMGVTRKTVYNVKDRY